MKRINLLCVLSASVLCLSDGFQLSMSSRSMDRSFSRSIPSPVPFGGGASLFPGLPVPGADISSTLISQLAVVALKVRLADQQDVSCDVTSTSSDLMLRGRVGPVTVKGKGWRSGRGLSCRAIEATVETCELDMSKVLSKRKLVLTTPALGKAMVALNSSDFTNFITHHLMKPPETTSSRQIEFLKEDAEIDPKNGQVTFLASFAGSKFRCALERGSGDKRALISAEAVDSDASEEAQQELTSAMSRFFNEMVFELHGTYLTFRDLMVTAKGGDPSVMLALNIKVQQLPSAGLL